MPRFKWHGPLAGQTFIANGKPVDVILMPDEEVALPEGALTECLIASGKLERLDEAQKPGRKATPAQEEDPNAR